MLSALGQTEPLHAFLCRSQNLGMGWKGPLKIISPTDVHISQNHKLDTSHLHLSAKHSAEAQRRSHQLRTEKLKMRPASQELSAGLVPFSAAPQSALRGGSMQLLEHLLTESWPCSLVGALSTNVQDPFQNL